MSWKATMINIHQYLQDQIQPFLLLSMLPSCSPIVPCICHLQLETATTCSKEAPISSKDLLQWSAPQVYIIWVSSFLLLSSSPVTAVLHKMKQRSTNLSSSVLQQRSWCNNSQKLQKQMTTYWNSDAHVALHSTVDLLQWSKLDSSSSKSNQNYV